MPKEFKKVFMIHLPKVSKQFLKYKIGYDIFVKMILGIFKGLRLIFIIMAIVIAGSFTFDKIIKKSQANKPSLNLTPEEINVPHFVNSLPAHNQILAFPPVNIVINFNKEITRYNSKISKDSQELSTNVSLDQDGKTLRLAPPPQDQNGIYQVEYHVCFKNENCTDGQFAYHIEDKKAVGVASATKKPEVKIYIADGSLQPEYVFVSLLTKIIWVNQTASPQTIRSEPPDSNNYYPPLNSPEIKPGDSFSAELKIPGEYFYFLLGNDRLKGRILAQ